MTLIRAVLLAMMTSIAFTAGAAQAAEEKGFIARDVEGEFEDVLFDLTSAIVDRGLVIDYTGHIDKMLERTADAVGSTTEYGSRSPYANAKYMHFCSAKLTHAVVSANPLNLAICPYVMFAFETKARPGIVTVGYRRPIADRSRLSTKALADVESLLGEIVSEVAGVSESN